MAICIRKEHYEKFIKKEPEQDFYDCWRHIASEIIKNETIQDEESDNYDNQWKEWNDFNR